MSVTFPYNPTQTYGTVAQLNALVAGGVAEGTPGYATDGRKTGEGAGVGTGIHCFFSHAGPVGAGWYIGSGGAVIAA